MAQGQQQAQDLVDQIRQDQNSGATQLAISALQSVRDWLGHGPRTGLELETLLSTLQAARPSMVPLANAITRCQQQFGPWQVPEDVAAQAEPVIHSVLSKLHSASESVAQHAAALIPPGATLLTHSRSSQVIALMQRLAQRAQPFSVICSQSSPGNEGFTLARELDALGVPVTLITDAQLGLFAAKADMVISGCDTWLADGYFVNKSGTYLMALAARDQGIPLWVLADSFKDSHHTQQSVTLEEMPAQELGGPTGPHIEIRNIYFETVPVRLITGRVSEQGAFSYPVGPAP